MRKINYVTLTIIAGVLLLFVAGCGDFWETGTNNNSNTDTTKPSVASQSPASGATGVSVNTGISITFSEDVFLDGFTVSGVSGTYSASYNFASFKPDRRLDYGTSYTATVKNVRDGNGNSLGDTSWSFTTASPSFNIYTTPDSHNYDVGKYNSIDIYGDKKYIAYQDTSDCSLRIISTTDGASFSGPYVIDSPSISGGCAGRDSSLVIDSTGTFHIVYLAETEENKETVGTGNGSTRVFTKTLTYLPVKKGKIKIYLKEGYSETEIGQDDGKGTIYDSNSSDSTTISGSSTIDYTSGVISLSFGTAPANRVEIIAAYTPDIDGVKYTTASDIAGTWQRTRLYSFPRTATETVDVGNGSTTQFTDTLTYLPVMKSTISILHDGVQIGQDNGRGTIIGTNIDSNNSTINYDTGQITLRYTQPPAYNVQITATYTQNDDIDASIYADITTDSSNKVHISFYDFKNTALRYATNKNGSWQTVIADDGASSDNPGMYTSIKVDDSGYVHISYYDYHTSVGNGNLKYVRGYVDGNGNWTWIEGPLTLDSTGEVGKYTSMALYNGKPYITYYDGTNSKVKLITNVSGDWEAQTVVSSITERMCPFTIESNGIMHMSYILNDTLYYLSKSWGWVTNSIESGIGNGNYTSIVVDSNGKAYISYYDATDQDLKYAHPIN